MFKKIVAAWPITRTEVLAWFGNGEVRQLDITTLDTYVPENLPSKPHTTVLEEGYGVVLPGEVEISSDDFYERSVGVDLVEPECRRIISEVISTRHDRGFSQQKIASASGMKQPVVARLETSSSSPRIDTLLRLLTPLGKTLEIADLDTTADVDSFLFLD